MLKYKLKVVVRADGREEWTLFKHSFLCFWEECTYGRICRAQFVWGSRETAIVGAIKHAAEHFAAQRACAAAKIVDRATVCTLQIRERDDGQPAVTAIHELRT